MKLLRNYTYVRDKFPRLEAKIVPYHVYEATRPYAAEYAATFGRAPGEGVESAG